MFINRSFDQANMSGPELGARALGLWNLLLITEDPPKMGNLPNATAVFDIDSVDLTNLVQRLNHGMDLGANPHRSGRESDGGQPEGGSEGIDIARGVWSEVGSELQGIQVSAPFGRVDLALEVLSGDQGMMFGYASDETDALMPAPVYFAHRLARRLSQVRKNGELPWLRPDGKTQVTVEYEDHRPVRIDTVVIGAQHDPDISHDSILDAVVEHVIGPCLPPMASNRRSMASNFGPRNSTNSRYSLLVMKGIYARGPGVDHVRMGRMRTDRPSPWKPPWA